MLLRRAARSNCVPAGGSATGAAAVRTLGSRSVTLLMPAEWMPHERTWMALPPPGGYVATYDEPALAAWLATANAVAQFEPVSLLVDAAVVDRVRSLVSADVELVPASIDDGWLRDNGPTFVHDLATGRLSAVDWVFNAWGGIQPHDRDAEVAPFVAQLAGVDVVTSPLVNEGGGIAVDGEGTVIVTETVQLHDRRNPGWTKEGVEQELARTIGATTVIWLERGLMGDMQHYRPEVATNGHVDVLASFVRPGTVVVHHQPDPDHHDHVVMAENVRRLQEATDAAGRRLEIVPVPAPADTVVDGVSIDHSYINFSFVNGGVVMSTYHDPVADDRAAGVLRDLCPGREVVAVDAVPIFRNGGGVHCITQQQPAPPSGQP
jgi:agmatine deiminase